MRNIIIAVGTSIINLNIHKYVIDIFFKTTLRFPWVIKSFKNIYWVTSRVKKRNYKDF